jgi:hypothetical protein
VILDVLELLQADPSNPCCHTQAMAQGPFQRKPAKAVDADSSGGLIHRPLLAPWSTFSFAGNNLRLFKE